ncbi:hypothetical protein GGI11_005306, partial [Coemansia sp. RSA 2049]
MYVSGEIQIVPIGPDVSFTKYIAKVKSILDASDLQHTMHDSGTNFQGDYALVTRVVEECMQSVMDNGAPRVLCYLKLGARTDKDYAKELPAAEKVKNYLDNQQDYARTSKDESIMVADSSDSIPDGADELPDDVMAAICSDKDMSIRIELAKKDGSGSKSDGTRSNDEIANLETVTTDDACFDPNLDTKGAMAIIEG